MRSLPVPTDRPGTAVGTGIRRRAAPALLTVFAGLATPSAEAAPPARAVLSATTTVTATVSAYVPVSVPRPMRVPGTTPPHVTVGNPAAFVALALVSDIPGDFSPGLVVTKLPVDDGAVRYAYAWVGHEGGREETDPIFFTRTLPPGGYQLYLVTSAPTTVTIRLPLPSGVTRLAARTAVSHHVVTSQATGAPGTAVPPSHTVTGVSEVKHRALLLGLVSWSHAGAVVERAGGCAYDGPVTMPDPEPVGQIPACPNGAPAVMAYGMIPGGSYAGQGYVYVAPGRWLQKYFVQVAGATTRIGGLAVWLDLVGR